MTGKPHPALKDFVAPPASLKWMVDDFITLHNRRGFTDMGQPKPIQLADIVSMAVDVEELCGRLRNTFVRMMSACDDEILQHYTEQQLKQNQPESEKQVTRRGSTTRPRHKPGQ